MTTEHTDEDRAATVALTNLANELATFLKAETAYKEEARKAMSALNAWIPTITDQVLKHVAGGEVVQ